MGKKELWCRAIAIVIVEKARVLAGGLGNQETPDDATQR